MRQRLLYALWLLCHDRIFYQKVRRFARPSDFPSGPLRWLARLALDTWEQHDCPLSGQLVALNAETVGPLDRTTASEVGRVYEELCREYAVEEEQRPAMREIALEALRLRRLGTRLDVAASAIESADPETAEKILLEAGLESKKPEQSLPLEAIDRILSIEEPDAIPTKIVALDQAWRGGIHPGQLAVVLAPTGVGKSMFLCYLAARAWRSNFRTVYYTDELSAEEILRRIVASILRRPIRDLEPEQVRENLQQIREQRSLDRAHLEVRFREAGSMVPADLRADLMADEFDVAMLDGDDLFRSRKRYDNRYMEYYDIYEGLRTTAELMNVAIWVSAQATREAIDRGTTSLRYIGDSFWKARKAYFVLGLAQEAIEPDRAIPPIHLTVLKDSVYGSRGLRVRLDPTFGRGDDGYPGFTQFRMKNLRELMGEDV